MAPKKISVEIWEKDRAGHLGAAVWHRIVIKFNFYFSKAVFSTSIRGYVIFVNTTCIK